MEWPKVSFYVARLRVYEEKIPRLYKSVGSSHEALKCTSIPFSVLVKLVLGFLKIFSHSAHK